MVKANHYNTKQPLVLLIYKYIISYLFKKYERGNIKLNNFNVIKKYII